MDTNAEMTATLDRYRRAQDGFDAMIAALPPERWDGPSACAGWSARDVLGHVIWGQELVRHLATGQTYDSRVGAPGAPHPAELVGNDPVATWRAARTASSVTLSPDALSRVVSLSFGEISLIGFITALVTDFLAHTWDIGHPAGMEVRLDPGLVTAAFDWARHNTLRGPGGIGAELPAPTGADEQARFLAFLGRADGSTR